MPDPFPIVGDEPIVPDLPSRTTVALAAGSIKNAMYVDKAINLRGLTNTVRYGLTLAAALTRAEEEEFDIELVGRNSGTRYSYKLNDPRHITRIRSDGQLASGKLEKRCLLETEDAPKRGRPSKPKLKVFGQ